MPPAAFEKPRPSLPGRAIRRDATGRSPRPAICGLPPASRARPRSRSTRRWPGTGLQADQHGLALLDRARAAEAQGDLKTARAKVNEAAKTIGEDPYLWYFSAALSLREEDVPTAKSSINRALAMAPDSAEVLFEAGHIAKAAGEDAQARDYWTKAAAADPRGPTGKAAREALGMTDAPLTVTNQVATRPDGDGEGGKEQ